MRIAAVAAPFERGIEPSLRTAERMIRRARAADASLLVLPECALGGHLGDALDPHGPEIDRLVAMAGDLVVCAGYTEKARGGSYSAAVCVNGEGVLGRHRKVHIPPSEAGLFRPGDGFAAFDTPMGRVGMLLCYDKVFPAAALALALDGAQVVASMAAWPVCRTNPAARVGDDRQTRQFNLLDQARALENQMVWASANHSGRYAGLTFIGHAKVVDQGGIVQARTCARGGIALADVDVSRALGRGTPYSHLDDRRPSSYPVAA
ncbi:MAG: carbon-nitrogen hydrolase family protein [Thermoleophilaceae bacterium]|nr:carbon-nitrogen hydrolase family protein [Thermoleophilaceae bacterium]